MSLLHKWALYDIIEMTSQLTDYNNQCIFFEIILTDVSVAHIEMIFNTVTDVLQWCLFY